MLTLHADEVRRLQRDPGAALPWARPVAGEIVVIDLEECRRAGVDGHWDPSVVVVGTDSADADPGDPARAVCDVVVEPGSAELERIAATVARNPVASLALARLLRRGDGLTVRQGLLAESAVYGTLQAGEEFRTWRSATPVKPLPQVSAPVLAERAGGTLELTLTRPERRNAFDATMRDALAEQLVLVQLDPSIIRVELRGAGAAFCSGGDLDEFGTATDASVAHLVRLDRSVGELIDDVRDRVTVHLHGACVGSGIELAAFAGTVVAAESTRIALPEVSMGLIPGAGGTVSLPRRIGRHRTAQLALVGEPIDADTALEWGLVDRTELPRG